MIIWDSANISKWSFFFQSEIVNEEFGFEDLGTSYDKYGLNGRITNSFLRYSTDVFTFQIGRAPIWWGQSWNYSIIQSGKIPSYDQVDMRVNFGRFQFEMLTGQLGSEILDNGKRIKRLIGGHRITYLPLHEKWLVCVGGQVIYTGENRSTEYHYLIPATAYNLTRYDNEEILINSEENNDNSMIFAYGRYIINQKISLFSEIIADDFQVDDRPIQNMFGIKVGADGFFKLNSLDFTWETDYTSINTWTYIHHGQFTNWQNKGRPIGYPIGPDLHSYRFQIDSWLNKKVLINLEYIKLNKGANNISSDWNNYNSLDDNFPSDPTIKSDFLNCSISYWGNSYIAEIGWSNFPNDFMFLLNDDKTPGSIIIKLSYFTQLAYPLRQ